MSEPLPVDGLGLDFRDLDERLQRIAQYSVSLKILKAVESIPLDEQQRAEIAAALTAAKGKFDASQATLTDAITPAP